MKSQRVAEVGSLLEEKLLYVLAGTDRQKAVRADGIQTAILVVPMVKS